MGAMPNPTAVEWRPGPAEVRAWSIVAVVMTLVALPLFGLPTLIQNHGTGSIRLGFIELLVIIALTALLVVTHEAIHGLVMLGFGARPTFGVVLVARAVPALYATSVGHRFTRLQYFVVAVSPALLISVVGFWLCYAGLTIYLLVPRPCTWVAALATGLPCCD
jgi:hypothetical protein